MLFSRTTRYLIVIAVYGLLACAPATVKKQQAFDFSKAGRIELQITAADRSVLPENLMRQVSQNLLGWHYPIGMQENTVFSHTLIATVKPVEHGSTPTGFSFSSGNSDPRALDFQKTDVLPIDCRLTTIDHPEQSAELKMGFSADQTSKLFLSTDKLADHISTVCFNLLNQLKWPLPMSKNTAEKTVISPSWMPEIRIESKDQSSVPIDKTAPVKKVDDKGLEVQTSSPNENEHGKQIIIYNQGSPVTLELGHHRR
ncbi:hypothetical protein [Crenothrix polyspora]|uniref:Lipoprotein n=1 Tax=Crenothrix polyspora TaxID=360316 RepID=A0A1R4HJV7_9GAMM|nr:hypothetical protein [Crenothrix polyspora]SJM96512.1 conserved hypothetical protein [Crenothrix polyspora]